jgi:Family of unknown function (DUF5343)
MAGKKNTYPVINVVRWWTLRKSFKRTIPDQVTKGYLSGVLNVTPDSAQNIISPLKKIGLIDSDDKPTERAKRWRDDEEYPGVCEEIRKAIYPSELLAAFPDADASRTGVERWFASKTGLGTSIVGGMAVFYLLLTEADPTKQDSFLTSAKASYPTTKSASSTAKLSTAKTKKIEKEASNGAVAVEAIEPEVKESSTKENLNGFVPALHIDIQIHISSDASAEQIDHIFASMAKHLYKGSSVNE